MDSLANSEDPGVMPQMWHFIMVCSASYDKTCDIQRNLKIITCEVHLIYAQWTTPGLLLQFV